MHKITTIFFYQFKHVFWVLKRSVSLRRFFWVPTTCLVVKYEQLFLLSALSRDLVDFLIAYQKFSIVHNPMRVSIEYQDRYCTLKCFNSTEFLAKLCAIVLIAAVL